MPKGKQFDTTTQTWRKTIGSYQEKELKKQYTSKQDDARETYPELYRQFNQSEFLFYRNLLLIARIKPGLIAAFVIFNILTRMALADENMVMIQQLQNPILRDGELDNYTPLPHADTPNGMCPKQPNFALHQSASDPLMKPYLEDPELLKLVEKVAIICPPIDYEAFKISEKVYVKTGNDMIKRIRINLAYILNTKLLKQIIKEHGIKITILHPFFMNYNQGVYDYDTNTILLAWDQHFSDSEIRDLLKNEMHHMSVCTKRGVGTEKCTTPPKFKKLNKIIEKGNQKIKEYAELFRSGQQLNDLEAVIGQYEPMLFQVPVTVYDHDMRMKTTSAKLLEDGRIFVPKGEVFIVRGEPYDKILVNNDFYIKLCQKDSNNIIYKICFAKDNSITSKITAFFIDCEIKQNHYKEDYFDSAFFKANLKNKVSEFASDLEELPEGLKELFYPEFCEIFSKFHHVDDYCSRLEVPLDSSSIG